MTSIVTMSVASGDGLKTVGCALYPRLPMKQVAPGRTTRSYTPGSVEPSL